MPIAALPQTTVRAIGSTSVISDACSVVKELLDNALDSGASSLQIEIAQNTLDVVQLKDNGCGIPPEDHPNVCKHAFTSKIETVDDLRNVGGISFGFRGEALASVAEMSGGVTITTRTASEVTAISLKYGRDGELTGSTRTSHPVGTTVRITDFLKHIPVRRQTALKAAAKTLTKLKGLLQAYAFAQPSKRLSFKVLKAKTESNNWQYAPSGEAALNDAALKIVGRDVASSCTLKEISSRSKDGNISDQGDYELAALLPKESIDITKLNNVGQYLSVDGRPLSTQNGVGQAIAKIFKMYLRAGGSRTETSAKVSDPFCCLKLKCPKGSYDVNIEPGKDDVLFSDRDLVISLVARLLNEHYGPLADGQKTESSHLKAASPSTPHGELRFDLLLARRRGVETMVQDTSANGDLPNSTPASPVSQRGLASSTSLSPDNSRSSETENGSKIANSRSESRYINPWSISRINASFQTPQRLGNPHSSFQHDTGDSADMTQGRNHPKSHGSSSSEESPEFPSPPSSSFAPWSPVNDRVPIRVTRVSPEGGNRTVDDSRRAARQRDKERYGNGALDTWFQRTIGRSLGRSALETASEQEESVPSLSQLAEERFQLHPQDRQTGPTAVMDSHEDSDDLIDASSHSLSRAVGNAASDHPDDQEGSMNSGRGFPVLEKWAASLHRDFDLANQADLERALDFERRKKEANRRNDARSTARETGSNLSNEPPVESSPHHNRFLAAKAVLNGERPLIVESNTRPALLPHDPRAYLMRHQKNEPLANGGTVMKLHTSKLPFERVPAGQDIHDICLPLSTDLSVIATTFHLTTLHDSFTQRGTDTDAFSMSDIDAMAPSWNQRLAALIKRHYQTIDRSRQPEWQVDLLPVLTRHVAQFNQS